MLQDPISEIKKDKQIIGYKIPNAEYKRTKLFFLSILWRASVSSHAYYSKIRLGRYEEIIKRLIWTQDPGFPEDFSFVLAKFTDEKYGNMMLDPVNIRWDRINYYQIYLFGFILYIKVDKRPTPKRFQPLIMTKNQDLLVTSRDIFASKELQVMLNIVNG